MAKPKVQAEIVPNQHCRQYHTNWKMSDERVGQMLEGYMCSDEQEALNKAPEVTKRIAIGVLGIVGVVNFSLNGYQLQVVKAPLFDWEEIEPQIIGLIRMVGQEFLSEEVEYIEKPIWEFQKWGYNEDGTKRRRGMFEETFDDLD
ncbi:MAG: hypothetical protein WC657_03180 [Candidatus Paceibacterota bacterium]|jgi:hypothetical protein